MIDESKKALGRRLRELRKKAGFRTPKDLADRCGVSERSVKSHEEGSRGIKPIIVKKYARAFRVDPEIILFPDRFNQFISENNEPILGFGVDLNLVPLIDVDHVHQYQQIARGGKPISDKFIFYPFKISADGRIFAVKQKDLSMSGAFPYAIEKDSCVYISPDSKAGPGDIVAAIAPDCDHLLIRKYRRPSSHSRDRDAFDLVALNEDFGSERDGHSYGISIIGRVIGVFRSFIDDMQILAEKV